MKLRRTKKTVPFLGHPVYNKIAFQSNADHLTTTYRQAFLVFVTLTLTLMTFANFLGQSFQTLEHF